MNVEDVQVAALAWISTNIYALEKWKSRASPNMGKSGRDGEPPPRGAPWETANAWRSARSSLTTPKFRGVSPQVGSSHFVKM